MKTGKEEFAQIVQPCEYIPSILDEHNWMYKSNTASSRNRPFIRVCMYDSIIPSLLSLVSFLFKKKKPYTTFTACPSKKKQKKNIMAKKIF